MRHFFLYTIIILASACTKLVDMPITNGPQFETSMVMTRDSSGVTITDSIKIVAGDDGAVYDSYSEVRNGVKVFVGEFTFEDGTKKLRFEYFDHSKPYDFADGLSLLNTATEFADFSSPFIGVLNVDSSVIHGQNVSAMNWSINGMQSNQGNYQISEPGIYDVELEVEFSGGSSNTIRNTVYLGFENPVWGYFNTTDLGGGEFEFQSVVQNSSATVQWIIDDTLVYQQNDLITSVGQGVHKIKMHVTDAEGHHYSRERNIGYYGNHFVEAFNFIKLNTKDLHNTLIISYENNGTVYSSKHVVQQNPLLSIGAESHILETGSDIVVNYPVEVEFQMLDPQNPTTSFTTVSLNGKIGFQVDK